MGLKDSLKRLVLIEEEEDGITPEEIQREEEKQSKEGRLSRKTFDGPQPSISSGKQADRSLPLEKRFSITNPNAFKLVLIEPKSFDECPKLVDSLKGRRPVIINLEKIETETARKIFDFLSGATYALNGNVQRVSNNIFIFAPENVDITANNGEKGFDFGAGMSPWR